jgi:excisionase family DNA binding protein
MKTTKRRPPRLDATNELMTVQQVAKYLRYSPRTIYRLLKNRQIHAFMLGTDWRFRRSDIDQWISGRQMWASTGPSPEAEAGRRSSGDDFRSPRHLLVTFLA